MKIKQIYSFEHFDSPVLTEAMLRRKSEQKTLKRQTVILAVCGAVFICCLIAKAIMLYPASAVLSIVIITYASVSFFGAGAIALVFSKTRRLRHITQ